MKDLPTDNEEALGEWLVQLFKEKVCAFVWPMGLPPLLPYLPLSLPLSLPPSLPQDELVDYHMKHKAFPGERVRLPQRVWPDVIIFLWVSLLGVPAFFATLYLFWIGAWFTIGLIVISVILGGPPWPSLLMTCACMSRVGGMNYGARMMSLYLMDDAVSEQTWYTKMSPFQGKY